MASKPAPLGQFSEWKRFPDPREGDFLCAPIGPGCYEVRRSDDGRLVLFGRSEHVAWRMTSLLPEPLGCGVRNNAKKRGYVLEHIERLRDIGPLPALLAMRRKKLRHF